MSPMTDPFNASRSAAITEQQVARAAASPRQSPRRQGIALCLSGGGFRAALLHLGAVRRLDQLGVLARIDTISSVSGGSIFAAFLARVIHQRFGSTGVPPGLSGPLFPDFQTAVADPFHVFVSLDARTEPLQRRLWPAYWFRPGTSVSGLAEHYERHLTNLALADLPVRPHFILCATDMVFGVNWEFDREKMGDWQAGYVPTPRHWPLARAVAASSCFPPLFSPFAMDQPPQRYQRGSYTGSDRFQLLGRMSLTDGGVYDNLGMEPVWKRHAIVLVSDGGGRFGFRWYSTPLSQVFQYSNIMQNQVGALRVRWFQSNLRSKVFQGAYWGLLSPGTSGRTPGPCYSRTLAVQRIGPIRTDMDVFSEAEIKVLENHGYLQADAALALAILEGKLAMTMMPTVIPSLDPPYPEFMDEARVFNELRDSHKRISLRRLWSWYWSFAEK
jgi:NTE family protein